MKKVTLVNLTGHPLDITGENGRVIRLQPVGQARVRGKLTTVDRVEIGEEGVIVPVLESEEKIIRDLPPPTEGVLFLVSGIVAARAHRDDVVSPSRVTRDHNGRAKSARALMRVKGMYDAEYQRPASHTAS